jgi:hypothetical protein
MSIVPRKRTSQADIHKAYGAEAGKRTTRSLFPLSTVPQSPKSPRRYRGLASAIPEIRCRVLSVLQLLEPLHLGFSDVIYLHSCRLCTSNAADSAVGRYQSASIFHCAQRLVTRPTVALKRHGERHQHCIRCPSRD